MPLLFGNTASSGSAIAYVTLSNTSGSAISNYTTPVTIPYNSKYSSNFSNLKFTLNGETLSHWIGKHTPSSTAQVYLKIGTLPTGTSKVAVGLSSTNLSSSTGIFKTFTDFPTAAIPSGWEVVSNGAIRTTDAGITAPELITINNYTAAAGKLTLCTNGGGPISILTTTADQGVNIAVDSYIVAEYDTLNVTSQGSILELGMHASPSKGTISLTNGLKYRWDARYANQDRGFITSYSRTNNIATFVLDQTDLNVNCRDLAAGDVMFYTAIPDATFNTLNSYTFSVSNKSLTSNVATLTTTQAHNYVAGDTVAISGVDATFNGSYVIKSTPTTTTFTYAVTAANVTSVAASGTVVVSKNIIASVSYNGNIATITYNNTGANVTSTVLSQLWPVGQYYWLGIRIRMNQGFLPNPYGGTYVVNTLTNDAGWNNFDDPHPQFATQSRTLANGAGDLPFIYSLRYTAGTFAPYVDNVATGRNFVDTGIRSGKIYGKALTSNVATITTVTNHGLAQGDTVTVSGVDSTFNGTYTILQVPGANTFTYTKTAANVTAVNFAPTGTSFSATSNRFSANGKVMIASHVGAAQLYWVGIYDTYANVSAPSYALAG